jgi:CRISPR-associated endonuclease/helicase Cas3
MLMTAILPSVMAATMPPGTGNPRARAPARALHDVGKAHKIWQDALCGLAPEERPHEITGGRPWAKSGTDKPLRFEGGVAFRHELASLLILDGPLDDLLADAPDADLAKYLVLAHHGKVRVQVRDPGDLNVLAAGEARDHKLLGLEEGTTTDTRRCSASPRPSSP